MFEFECPKCGKTIELEAEELPLNSCDSTEVECGECGEIFKISWYAEDR